MNSNSPLPLFDKYILLVNRINYNEGADIVKVSTSINYADVFVYYSFSFLVFWG